MSQSNISEAEEEYLETFFWFLEYGNRHVKTNQIAEMMNVDPSTVTSMFKKLYRKELIDYKPYYGAQLTAKIHEEACKWEHVLTDDISEMIEKKIQPSKTPYGAFIPQKDGSLSVNPESKPLALLSEGHLIEIVEIIERAIARHFPQEATLQEVYAELEKKGLKPEKKFLILSTYAREDVHIEKWSLSYDLDMILKNMKEEVIEIPYYLVNMIFAKEIEKE